MPEPFMAMVVVETRKPPARVWRAALQGTIDDRPDPIATIPVPTLLCWASRIPDSELRIYEDGGHALHWERPARFAADLIEFAATRTPA